MSPEILAPSWVNPTDSNMTPSESIATISNASVVYGKGEAQVVALGPMSVEIAPGELLGVVGVSGSGKSTLLNVLAGRQRPSAGSVVLHRRGLVMLMNQDHALVPFLTVGENVRLAAELHRRRGADIAGVRDEALATVGAAELTDRYVNQISGGQRQRVALAQCLVAAPVLLLADEPTSSLDATASIEIAELFGRVAASGQTVVVATHDPLVSERCDRIIDLRGNVARAGFAG